MRVAIVVALALSMTVLAAPADAETVGVGDCVKFSGACAAVCVAATEPCWEDGALACFGISYQVPFCVVLR